MTKTSEHEPAIADDLLWQAVLSRDAASDGQFVFGVTSTGIYCRPSCPARRPRRSNVLFFDSPREAERAGLRACLRCHPTQPAAGAALVERICRYIEAHAGEKVTLARLARFAGVSPFHLQRSFTREMGISPRQYLESCRFSNFKRQLRRGSVTDSLVEAGYSSPSRLYETAKGKLGMTPKQFRAGAPNEQLRFTTFSTEIGDVLLAASAAGICGVQFLDGRDPEALLHSEYPLANAVRDDAGLKVWAGATAELIRGGSASRSLPLDIRGTAFQQRVWQELQRIPAGQTRTYSDIARKIGRPAAVRAVANACAANHLAVVVPCHRVVRSGGELSGYRWGVGRKQHLLEREAADGEA